MTSNASVREVSASDSAALRRFVALERKLVGSNPLFVSDIDEDIVKRLSGRSHFFSDTDCVLYVASDGSRDVARCTAKINHRYQQAKGEAVGFIGHFAAAPDSEGPVHAMLVRAEGWLQERGVTRVIAPFNGAAVLGAGFRSSDFHDEPMFPTVWHPPYYAGYLSSLAYRPTYPLWQYTIDFASDRFRAAQERAAGNAEVVVRAVNKKRWRQDLETIRHLLTETFKEEWEFHPLTSDEFHEFMDPLKPVLDTRQLLIGEVNGNPAGWCMGFPDWTPLFRSFKGKLGPIQIVRLLLQSGSYSRAGLLGIGVLPEYKGKGLAQALAVALYSRYEERGLKEAFYYPVNESNTRSRRFAESMGGTGRVLYHCYDKPLV